MITRKIGLAGRSGSGKDLVADFLCSRYGYHKIAVADAIRDEITQFLKDCLCHGADAYDLQTSDDSSTSFDIVADALVGMVHEKPTPSGIRVLLQWWGTEFRRSQDDGYWVTRLQQRLDTDDLIVVSDVRTPDEMHVIRERGGEIWLVERQGVKPVGISNHFTEVGLNGMHFDHVFHNDRTIEELYSDVEKLISLSCDVLVVS